MMSEKDLNSIENETYNKQNNGDTGMMSEKDLNSIENETVLKHVIMHEYCHYKHRDYL